MLFRKFPATDYLCYVMPLKSAIKNAFFSVITGYVFGKKELESIGRCATLIIAFSGRRLFRFVSVLKTHRATALSFLLNQTILCLRTLIFVG
jgi:hypothetical protein